MGYLVEFASLSLMLVFLAVCLSVVGFGVSKLLHRWIGARAQSSNQARTRVVTAKSRAAHRSSVRA